MLSNSIRDLKGNPIAIKTYVYKLVLAKKRVEFPLDYRVFP